MMAVIANPNRSADLVLNIARFLLSGLFVFMLIAALHPDVRSAVRGTVSPNFRNVVSTAQADLAGNGSQMTIVKIKTQDSLILEVYEPTADGAQKLVERIKLADKKDGFFTFNGQATNLAADDIDGDGKAEILAPSFDKNLVGRLNIYRYDSESRGFRTVIR